MEFDPIFKPDLRATIESYGVFVTSYGAGWVKVLCPRFDHPERRPSATVNLDAGKWNCFACDAHGDALDLIQYNEGLSDAREAATYAENHGIPGSSDAVSDRFRRKSGTGVRRSAGDQREGRERPAARVGRWH